MKKIFTLFISLFIALSLSAYDFRSGDLFYNITSSSEPYTVEVACALSSITTATIPRTVTYNGTIYSVTSIGYPAFYMCESLTSVTIPNGVTNIGNSVFYGCSSLTSITIPNSVTSIGDDAFYDCDGLTSITIPNSVTSIGNYAFLNCDGLTSITIPNNITSIGQEVFSSCSSLTSVVWNAKSCADFSSYYDAPFYYIKSQITSFSFGDDVEYIPADLCSGMSKLISITIPNSVTSIGNYAFYGCSGLTSLTIPNSVTSIGQSAFYGCSGLTSVTLGNSVTSIGKDAFFDCDGLTSITIPNSVTSIGESAFSNCNSLTSLVWNAKSCDDFQNPFDTYDCKITSLTIGESVQDIPEYLCSYMGKLTSVVWNVKSYDDFLEYGDSPFSDYNPITSFTFGESVQHIPAYLCTGIDNLTSVTIGSNVTSIGNNAFYGCDALTSITIPNSVTSIGYGAFAYCSEFNTIHVEATEPPILGNGVFNNTPLSKCDIPCGTLAAYQASDWASQVGAFEDPCYIDPTWQITYTSSNDSIVTPSATDVFGANIVNNTYENGVGTLTFDGPVTSIGNKAFYRCSTLTSISIPNSVTSIGSHAFCDCPSLTSITIPNSVTSIGSGAFLDCSSLLSITIPDGVTKLEAHTFACCYKLQNVILPNSLTFIDDNVFSECYSLVSITIPSSVTNIGLHAFSDCWSLTEITIPNSVMSIEDEAFYCCNSLTSVTLNSNTFVSETSRMGGKFGSQVTEYVIGEGVTSIGNHAFCDCPSLTSITIPNSVTSIGSGAFLDCSSLLSITIPDGVTKLEAHTFACCYKLQNVILPNSLTFIDDNVFSECYSLVSITIPSSVTNIGHCAFSDCPLDTIHVEVTPPLALGARNPFTSSPVCVIPCGTLSAYEASDWASQVGEFIEEDCPEPIDPTWQITYTSTDGNIVTPYKTDVFGANIVSNTYENGQGIITFDGPVTSIGEEAFYHCTSLASITIPNSVISIGVAAFSNCGSLNFMVIPEGVTTIGSNAFQQCFSLQSIYIPRSVTSIGDAIFIIASMLGTIVVDDSNMVYDSRSNCNAIIETATNTLIAGCQNTVIPNSVATIGNEAFAHCYDLTSITIPNSVTSIGDRAFYVCSSLTSITIPNSVTSIGDYAFSSCSGLTSIVVEGGNATYDSRENCNAIIETATNTLIAGCKNTIIPNSVTSIGADAFYSCKGLTSITIPNSVTSIGESAFSGCSSLTSITIPNSVTSIGDDAFWGCSSLTSITIPNSVTSIGEGAFVHCEGLTSITIPNSVTSIGSSAFSGCSSLTSITIPNSVTSIGRRAFLSCSSLDTIHVEATTPPALEDSTVFMNTPSPTCYIPCGTLAAYQASDWAKYMGEFVEVCPTVVKAKVPAAWENDDITVWVWTDGAGTEYPTTKEGDWYVYTHTDDTEFNIIFKSGTGWKGNTYQTVDINGITENTCLEIQPTNTKATYTIVDCPSIIYELNGGVTNDYDWMSKADMYHDLLVDINAIIPTTKVDVDTVTLAYSKTLSVGEGIPAWWTNLDPLLDDIHFMTKWGWLITYMDGICVEQDAALQTIFRGSLFLRYHLAAFFIEDICPYGSVDYSIAGKDEAYIPAWKHGYANPTAPTDEFVLNMPYRECYTFDGWYADANFAGEQVITVDSSFNGTLYAKWVESDCPIANPVSWELEGGISPVELPTHITSAYVLPTPIRDGYVFMEWYHGNTLGIEIPMTILPIGYTGTLYAQWKKEPTDALNPFAYALSSELSQDKSQLLVNYSLNARAMDVQIVIMDGETAVKTIACDGLSKGSHSIAIPTAGLPEHKQLTWKVEVKGAEVTEPTEYAVNYSFYHPSAVDIDNNPENPTFGMILTNEGMHEVKDINGYLSTGYGAGIYAFNPAFEPMPNGSNPGYNGGIEFTNGRADDTTRIAFAPRRIRISEDGRIFVTSQNTDGNYLWEVNPENMNEWNSIFKGTLNEQCALVDAGGNFIAAPNNGFDVRGAGEDLQLMMYADRVSGSNNSPSKGSYRCDEYNLGTATTWAIAPTKNWVGDKDAKNFRGTQVEYDNEGGIWLAYYNNSSIVNENYPGLVHINKDGVEDVKLLWSNINNAGIRFNHDFTKMILAGNNGIDRKATLYNVSKDINGVPVLTEEFVIDATYILGRSLNDFAFDYAGNLYACGHSTKNGEKIVAWAMPRSADEVITTPAASKYNFTYSDDAITYVLNGGVTNDYGWMSKDDMYHDLLVDINAIIPTTSVDVDTVTLAYDKTKNIQKGIPTYWDDLSSLLIHSDFLSKWGWLINYMDSACASESKYLPSTLSVYLRYNLSAFFFEKEYTSWPQTPDYSKYGLYPYYQPAWQHAYDNPTNPTEEFILNAPYREGYTFAGWYTNADLSGEKITIVEAETNDTLYAKWIENSLVESTWKVLYTSTNGGIVAPNAIDVFGANIISNTYENGVGTITFDGPVTSIGGSAFAHCSSLTSFIIPNSVTKIGPSAFHQCSSLTSISIPNSVTSIGMRAFIGCSSLISMVVEQGNIIYDSRNNCNAIVETATNTLVAGCQKTIIPNSIVTIGDWAFQYCSSLTSITIPESVTIIGKLAFYRCSSLTSITIPNSIMSIARAAFYSCSSLTSITIPNSIMSIAGAAFSGCSSLDTIYVEATTPPALEDSTVFRNTPSPVCVIPCGTLAAYQASDWASQVGGFVEDCVEGQQIYYTSTDGNIVTPNATDVFGANIVSNTYENGVGTITFDGPVTKIGDLAFQSCISLKSITISNTVTSIGKNAFNKCHNLNSITIPNSVISIESRAFAYTTSLTSIVIPSSVTNIGDYAFNRCTSLSSIFISNSVTNIGYKTFAGCYGLISMIVENGNIVYDSRENCNAIIETATNTLISGCQNTIIPESVMSIGDYAFDHCRDLTSISIPSNVLSIGDYAFVNCHSLSSVFISNSVTTIGKMAFQYCSSLDTIHVEATTPPALEDSTVFMNTPAPICVIPCGTLAAYEASDWASQVGGFVEDCVEGQQIYYTSTDGNIVTPNATDVFGANIVSNIYENGVGTITFEAPITSIGDSAFYQCKSLASITIPNSVTSIGKRAFHSCYSLTSVTIPNSVTSIGNDAFYDCDGLISITIPNSVTSIGGFAFGACSSITSITIPNSVVSIKNSAFAYCSSLISISIPSSVTSIGERICEGCSSLISIVVEESNKIYDSRMNCNAIIETATNTLVAGCQNTIIPHSVMSIGDAAFSECSSLNSIIIPNSVTTLGCSAFYGCVSLTSIGIPSSITKIGVSAFSGCYYLDTIYVEATTPPTLGEYAFTGTLSPVCVVPCGTLAAYEASNWASQVGSFVEECVEGQQITYTSTNDSIVTPYDVNAFDANIVSNVYENGVGTITFDGPVTTIGYYAFHNCDSLISIIIPNSVKNIGYGAFSGCVSLESITIGSGVTTIGEDVFGGCGMLTSIEVDANNVTFDSREDCNAIIKTANNILVAGCKTTVIPSGIKGIGNNAFAGNWDLTSIEIPDGVETIGSSAFGGCTLLRSVTLPNTLTTIGNDAFSTCPALTSITIPSSVKKIDDDAFWCDYALDTIYVEATTPPTLGYNVFYYVSVSHCFIPCGTLAAYEASDWAKYMGEFVEEGCALIQMCGDDLYWEYADGVLTITGTGDMYDYAADTDVPWYDVRGNIKTINMPDEMTKIGDYAFYKCTALTSVTLPEQLKHIGNRAFAQDTKIAGNIVIPEGVNYIEERAFFNLTGVSQFQVLATTPPTLESTNVFTNVNAPIVIPCGYGLVYRKANIWKDLNLSTCEVLIDNLYYMPVGDNEAHIIGYDNKPAGTLTIPGSVVIGSKTRTVTTLADSLFFDCKEISSVIFNEGLESIGERAYVRCGLTGTIVLPSTLTTIGERAFSYCDNVEKYILQAMTPPALANDVFTGSNSKALFYISCEAMDDYKVATNWSSLNSRLRDACLNIYHYNTALGANGVYTTEDTLVASIYYRRKFTPYRWETLYLPFEVDRVTVLEDGVEYDLTAWDIVYGGHYFLAKPDGMLNKEILFGFTDELASHTPYIIQFSDAYYTDKLITFYGKESWNKLSTSFEVLSSSAWMQIAGNTTLQDQLLEKPVYMLRSGLDFILQKTTTTLHPFECYVMPYTAQSGAPARMNVRLRDDVATAVESVKGNESHLTYTVDGYTLTVYPQGQAFSIYSLNGALIYSCEAGKEAVDCELNSGCYLLHAGAEAHKIML